MQLIFQLIYLLINVDTKNWLKTTTGIWEPRLPNNVNVNNMSEEDQLAVSDLMSNYSVQQENLFNATSDPTAHCDFSGHSWLEAKLILISICGSIVAIFGIFGNLTTALILTRPSMRSPNNLYLTALAVFDTCLLITAILIYSVEYVIEYMDNFQMYVAWLTYLRFCFALSHISQTGSVYITVAVTIERFLAVCHPSRARYACTKRGASVSILGVTCFAILFNCTKFFELEIKRQSGCPRFSAYSLAAGPLTRTAGYQLIYSLWMSNIIMVFLPFITLLVFNSIIAWTIRKSLRHMYHNDRFSERNELKEKSKDATLVLIIIVAMFLICNLWGFVITLLEVICGQRFLYSQWRKFYAFSREAINFLAMINSSVNFIIYIIFGKDFRKELIVVYGCSEGITLSLPTEDKFSTWRSIRRKMSYAQGFRANFGSRKRTKRDGSRCTSPDNNYNEAQQKHAMSQKSQQHLLSQDDAMRHLSIPQPHWMENGSAISEGNCVSLVEDSSTGYPRAGFQLLDPRIQEVELETPNLKSSPMICCLQPNGNIRQTKAAHRTGADSPETNVDIFEFEPVSPISFNFDNEETIWL